MYEFEIVRYERHGEGKEPMGRLWAIDVDSAEVLGIEFLGWPLRAKVQTSFNRQSGSMFAWDDDYQYGAVCLGGPEDRFVLGEKDDSE